jgi:hypothetical protein
LDTTTDFGTIDRDGRRSNGLPNGPDEHDVLEIHETSFVKAGWLWVLAQFQESCEYPFLD